MSTITSRVVADARRRGLRVLDRGDWVTSLERVYQERRKTRPHKLLPDRPADTLWQHITVTNDSGPLVGDFKRDMRTIERIGWERFASGVSYNFCVDMRTGVVGVGQPLDAKGTHTVNYKGTPGFSYDQNAVALAVAWLGMPGTRPTDDAVRSMGRLVAALVHEKALTPGHDYVPHSLVAAKDCPTDAGREVMPRVRRIARRQADK